VSSLRNAPRDPGLHPLTGAVFGDDSDIMVVFIHGDASSGGAADYLYNFAKDLATYKDVIAIAILRPGYWDSHGRKSVGSNNRRRDHYTAENNKLLADTIAYFKAENGIERVIAMGHSGGAAQLGVIIGQCPGLIDVAILVSCPCDVKAWRKHRKPKGKGWPNSRSPMDFVKQVDRKTIVDALTGSEDTNTLPRFARKYIEKLVGCVPNAHFEEIKGGDHRFGTLAAEVMVKIKSRLGTH